MPTKSLYKQITQPRETYTDGYGTTREVWEPQAVTAARKVYNTTKRFFNGPENMNVIGGAGALEFANPTIALGPLAKISNIIGEYDDAVKALQRINDESKALRLPMPSFANKYARDAERYERYLWNAGQDLQPFIDSGELKQAFEKTDLNALSDMMRDKSDLLKWQRGEFWERFKELKNAGRKDAAKTTAKELREQFGKLYRFNK